MKQIKNLRNLRTSPVISNTLNIRRSHDQFNNVHWLTRPKDYITREFLYMAI